MALSPTSTTPHEDGDGGGPGGQAGPARVALERAAVTAARRMENAMAGKKYPGYEALDPFLDLVVDALRDRVDGDHFWDILADDAAMEYPYHLPGFPEQTKGRDALMEMFRPYG